MHRSLRFILISVLAALQGGCGLFTPAPPDPRIFTFISKPNTSREFLAEPYARQFSMYQWAQRYSYGYRYSNALPYNIASNGKAIMPFLTEQLGAAPDARTQEEILYIFAIMTSRGKYDVGRDAEVFPLLEPVVQAMKSGWTRDYALWDLDFIRDLKSDRPTPAGRNL